MRMLRANLLDGVGIDSYGDYYREYRSIEAITRTGPQRVTNTAHNIFLDIFAGAGLLAGILFLMLVLLTGFSIIKSLRSNNFVSLDFQALCAMWFGFVVFCLISINQIGVGIWGFIFMGAINGCMAKFNSGDLESFQKPATLKRAIKKSQLYEKSRLESDKNIVKSGKIIRVSFSFFLAAIMFCMALIPNWADAKYLATVKNKDLDAARAIVEVKGIQDYHVENLISSLEIAGRPKDALDLALSLSERNPRNWDAWVHIVSSSVSTSEQKDVAARRLLQLDPKNLLVREELRKLSIP